MKDAARRDGPGAYPSWMILEQGWAHYPTPGYRWAFKRETVFHDLDEPSASFSLVAEPHVRQARMKQLLWPSK